MASAMKPAWLDATRTVTAGYSARSWSRAVLTVRATATVLAPLSLNTRMPTASAPSMRASDTRSAKPSTTRPTSRRRTTPPAPAESMAAPPAATPGNAPAPPAAAPLRPTTTSPIWSTDVNSPSVRSG